jgi:hypothetical protein
MMLITEILTAAVKKTLCRAQTRKPAAPVDLEFCLLKAKNVACRLQHCNHRLISAQVEEIMLTDRLGRHHIHAMIIRHKSFKVVATSILMLAGCSAARAADQARTIVNALDPKSMNELFEVSRQQPDAALTNIAPVSANTFRFLFIWPTSNPIMTYERVGRSFAERFSGFADQLRLLATGFCLPSRSMYYGSAPYGEGEVNVAYRDIVVQYQFGWKSSCPGRYISIAELDQLMKPAQTSEGYGALPETPLSPPKLPATPADGLKPFLSPPPPVPLE